MAIKIPAFARKSLPRNWGNLAESWTGGASGLINPPGRRNTLVFKSQNKKKPAM